MATYSVDSNPAGSTWNDPRFRAIVYQIIALALVIGAGLYLRHNLVQNMEERGIAQGFGFLDREAGFAISEGLIDYEPANSYGRALVVGLLNTLQVAAFGIFLATILGIFVGVLRLSGNWLVAKLASVYVETVRNVPLLLQLFVWYAIITESMPHPREQYQPISDLCVPWTIWCLDLPDLFFSNRGIMLPAPAADPIHPFIILALLIGIVASVFVSRIAKRRQDETGDRRVPVGSFLIQPFTAQLALVIGLPFLVWLIGGAPTELNEPSLQGFNFRGGLTLSPEFAAVLLGLTFYTAGFIAEIVRSGILAVPHGQTEAAGALGLRPGMTLRLVTLPQALRIIIPPTTSQYLNLTKNSSLAVAVGYPDLVSVGNTTLNQTGQALEAISIYMAVYLIFSLSISLFMNWYNRRMALVER